MVNEIIDVLSKENIKRRRVWNTMHKRLALMV